MKNIFLILLFLSMHAISQTVTVVGISSNNPVSFASIACYQNGKFSTGNYADKNGKFNLNGHDFDALEISCIGFQTKRITKEDVAEKIFLMEAVINLKEVVINSNQTVDIGYSKSKRKKIKSRLGIGESIQMATFIENPFNTPVVIKSVSFNVVSVTGRPAYRLHLYRKLEQKSIAGEDIPGEDILVKDLVCFLEEKTKGLVEIDLSEMGIEMPPEGLYVGLEGLGSYDENGKAENDGFIPEMFQTFEPIHCYNYDFPQRAIGWVNNNQRIERDEKDMNMNVTKKAFTAPSFGLEVYKP